MSGLAHAQAVNVTTFHYDNSLSGANTQETILTPSNVNSLTFGKLFSVATDGVVYAQPLYLTGVSIAGGTHNVVYVADEHDSVYAIDADSGTVYAQVNLIPAGGSTVSGPTDLGCTDVIPEVGITGTPVIDASTNTLYVVAVNKNADASFSQYLHALDVTTLAEKFGGPVAINAAVAGDANDGNGTTVTFNTKLAFQRPGLMLENHHVIISWGSHCDDLPWHGWVMSYAAATGLAQEAVLNITPNGSGGGLWMSGGGLASDSSGNIYFPTGNGTWNGTTDFGNSIVKLGPPSGGTFPVLDYFTPWNWNTLYTTNSDVSAGGLILLPPLASGTQLLVQAGKSGNIELVNTKNMGHECGGCTSINTNIVQELVGGAGPILGSPAYWNGKVYWGPLGSTLESFSFNAGNSGLLGTTPTSRSAQAFSFAAPTPSISASSPTANGILWALDGSARNSTCGTGGTNCLGLYAYDATNLANLLYSSSQSANDPPGPAVKFQSPVVTNGKVYIGTQSGLSAYGLLSHSPTADTPVFSLAAGTYTSTQSVSLSDGTPNATIYYTTDGTMPVPGTSAVYNNTPFSIGATTTINAIAVSNGYVNSAIGSATYTFAVAGTPVAVNLSGVDNVTAIGTPGKAPPNGGLDGAGYAYDSALLPSSITFAGSTFTFGAANALDAVSGKTITLPAGTYVTLNLLGTAAGGNQPAQTFTVTYSDGTTSVFTQGMSDWSACCYAGETVVATMAERIAPSGALSAGSWNLFGYSFALNTAKTVTSITLPASRDVVVLAIDLIPVVAVAPTEATPQFSPTPATYTAATKITLSDSTGGTIYYTTNGAQPNTSSTQYSAPFTLSTTTTINAIAVGSGYNNSQVGNATYTIALAGAPVSVSLLSADNTYGIANPGTPVTGGGLDGADYAYNGALLGSTLTWSGSTFSFGAAGALDAVSSQTITLPAGNYSTLNFLGAGVSGNQPNQTFIVNYSNGTSATYHQGMSDWFQPQGYAGESIVSTMATRIAPNGATSAGPCYLYGYSFALSSNLTVTSITLPANVNVKILAIDLVPVSTTPQEASPGFSPTPGVFNTTTPVTLSDSTGGTIYYTLDGSQPNANTSPVYSTPLQIAATTTINAFAVGTGYTNSPVSTATYTIAPPGSPVPVTLSGTDNVYGIANPGTPVTGGGLDGSNYAYNAALLGSTLTWSGSTFSFGPAGALDAVSNQTITLPAGNYSTLNFLGAGVSGNQPNQTFIVNYSNGTSATYHQGMSDWFQPQGYAGESIVSTMATRIAPNGATSAGPCYLYGYSFALSSNLTVTSITLPANANVKILAIDLVPVSTTPQEASPGFSPTPGVFNTTTPVTLTDSTGGTIYYTLDGSQPNANTSPVYSTPLQIAATTTINAFAVGTGYTNSPVSTATYTIAPPGSPVPVTLSGTDNVYGIANPGTPVTGGGLDGSNYAYNAALLGSTLTWSGSTFSFGAAGALDAVSNQTITLPAGNYSTLNFLGAGVSGNQPNQTFIVNYSNGTSATYHQGMSDWFQPQGYAGESIVSTMATRIAPNGATSAGPCYLYGYSFALSSNLTVTSITLPANANVKILAIDLVPVSTTPQEASPGFSPTPGVFNTTTPVTLTDSTGGTIYYTLDGSQPNANTSPVYSTPLQIAATTTINAFAVGTGYTNSPVSTATYTIAPPGSKVAVSLSSADNTYGIASPGTPVTGGGLDGSNYAYNAALLGTSLVWAGTTYTLGAPGVLDAVNSQTITLPAGNYSTLNFLGAGVGGNQPAQSFKVTYSDNSTATYTQGMSDWFHPQGYAGETAVATMATRIAPNGATSSGPCYLYGYSFALTSAKTVTSITLPANRYAVVLAIELLP